MTTSQPTPNQAFMSQLSNPSAVLPLRHPKK